MCNFPSNEKIWRRIEHGALASFKRIVTALDSSIIGFTVISINQSINKTVIVPISYVIIYGRIYIEKASSWPSLSFYTRGNKSIRTCGA